MKITLGLLMLLGGFLIGFTQPSSKANIVNLNTANWDLDKESDSVVLHTDEATGGLELLVRFPAGHVIPAHFHDSNERIIVAEGQLTLSRAEGKAVINAGGYGYLPAHEVQRLSCTSSTRCTFYLFWDGNPKSHPAQ